MSEWKRVFIHVSPVFVSCHLCRRTRNIEEYGGRQNQVVEQSNGKVLRSDFRYDLRSHQRGTRKEADLQDLFTTESCRSSAVDHVQVMSLESPRKRQDVQEVMGESAGKKGKRRRWKPKSFRTRWKASASTLTVNVTMHGGK